MKFSADGQYILSGSSDKSARLWAIGGGLVHIFNNHEASVNAVAFSMDGQSIITGTSNGKISKWLSTTALIPKLTVFQKIQNKLKFAESDLFQTKRYDLLELYANQLIINLDKKKDTTAFEGQVAIIKRIYDVLTDSNRLKTINSGELINLKSRLDELKTPLTKEKLRFIVKSYSNFLIPFLPKLKRMENDFVLDEQVKTRILNIENVFASGSAEGSYEDISIYNDGKPDETGNRTRQISYGIGQSSEQGNLKDIIKIYIDNDGKYANEFRPYLPQIGVNALADDRGFLELLKTAGQKDSIMQRVQYDVFNNRYYLPALRFSRDNGFKYPLSMLVVYDSYIHSGSISNFLRNRFPETTPKLGGDEKAWIKAYVKTRHEWLLSKGGVLAKTVYHADETTSPVANAATSHRDQVSNR